MGAHAKNIYVLVYWAIIRVFVCHYDYVRSARVVVGAIVTVLLLLALLLLYGQ